MAAGGIVPAWYNEIDPYAAQWLRNLIAAGHIAPGDVDERSIVDVRPDDLRPYDQCHFFAGIGGWSIALRLAGWPDDRSVWTGSCPCQPFSTAGQGKAADDERHLWPAWSSLIAECRPAIVFGEQVEAAIGWGWLDVVFADLEAAGYACGAAVLPACGVGAPHIRQRVWFVADADEGRSGRHTGTILGAQGEVGRGVRRVADSIELGGTTRRMADAVRAGRPEGRAGTGNGSVASGGELGGLAFPGGAEWQPGRPRRDGENGGGTHAQPAGPSDAGFWSDIEWLPCTDGKARPIEPGSFPLASGIHARPSKLRAYGNAIVPQVAAEFIRAAAG